MLKDQKEFYKVCFDSMQMGILVCDKNKEIVLSNNPLSFIFGYNEGELQEENIDILFKNLTLFDDFIKNSQKEEFKEIIEYVGVKKNGKEFPIELSFGKIEYENQKYYKALISDISLRKEKENKLSNLTNILEEEVKLKNEDLVKAVKQLKISLNKEIELNRLKTKFLALASHEFRTPLSSILSSTELIVKYADLQKFIKRDEHVIKVKSMISHLNGMLDDFLTLENIEKGNIQENFSLFKLNELFKEIISCAKPFLKNKQTLHFKNSVKDIIYQDPKIIKIIVTNLLYNAIKYSGEGDKVKLEIGANNKTIYFSVEDNGIGIPEDEQHLIFNRFFRAKNALFHSGTGIGLNIVKGYTEKLKGEIYFESIENKGTMFKVELPKINSHEKNNIIN